MPEAVRLLIKDVDACLTFYQCEHHLHPLVRPTCLSDCLSLDRHSQ
jgi:hypothetical protein